MMGKSTIFSSETRIRKNNFNIIKDNKACQDVLVSLRSLEHFWDDFEYLSLDTDIVFCHNRVFFLSRISISLECTMGSIVSCCEHGCIADTNTLLRKYRDDLFFYLYILVYDSEKKLGVGSKYLLEMEQNIESWLQNELNNLNINMVLKAIASSSYLHDAVKTYKLKSDFDGISRRLNNFVHGNGYRFYNQPSNSYKDTELALEMTQICNDAKYVTVVFLFLLMLCSPMKMMSTDYIDSLDCGIQPPDGSQYWVAPFIQKFLVENESLISENCLQYLRDNTSMEI